MADILFLVELNSQIFNNSYSDELPVKVFSMVTPFGLRMVNL